jgi:hypothetical protein
VSRARVAALRSSTPARLRRTPELLRHMVTLRDKDSGEVLGTVGDDDLQFLVDQLEEESDDDSDYYIDADTIEMLEEDGASAELIALLRTGLGDREGFEVQWSRG